LLLRAMHHLWCDPKYCHLWQQLARILVITIMERHQYQLSWLFRLFWWIELQDLLHGCQVPHHHWHTDVTHPDQQEYNHSPYTRPWLKPYLTPSKLSGRPPSSTL
jgi:hypothetical protein